MSKNNKRSIFSWIIISIVAVINIFIVTLPLTNLVGYEFSAVNGLLLAFFGGILFLINLKKDDAFSSFVKNNQLYLAFLIIIPLVIGFINHAFFEICPFTVDILFYFVITVPTFVIILFIAYWSSFAAYKYRFYTFFVILLVFVFVSVFEIYFNPQVYLYNPLIGFFPGTIYDEDISISLSLVIYRVLFLVVSSIFVLSAHYGIKMNIRKWKVLPIPAIVLLLFFLFKPEMGFATDSNRLQHELRNHKRTEHFELYFSPFIPEDQQNRLALLHEYHYQDISRTINVGKSERVKSYIFKDSVEKRRLFGAGNADVAKPWLKSIYIEANSGFRSLRHELAHYFSSDYGVTPFEVAAGFNPSLIEGFAMAIENNYNDLPIHYLAWMARESEYKIDLQQLFSGFNFFTNVSSFSYIISGSFLRFLSEKYGYESLKKLYGNGEFQMVYGKQLIELEAEYNEFLDSKEYEINKSLANLYFGRKPLIKKICPRYVANRLKEAGETYTSGDYSESISLYNEIYSYSGSYNALVGLTESYRKICKYDSSFSILSSAKERFEGTTYYFNILLLLGDYSVLRDDFSEAEKYYQELFDISPSDRYTNLAKLRMYMNNSDSTILTNYVKGSDYDRYSILQKVSDQEKTGQFLTNAISLSRRLKENYKLFLDKFVNELSVVNDEFFRILDLVKYAFDNEDYESSEKWISSVLNSNRMTDEKKEIYLQYKRLFQWINENRLRIEIEDIL